MVAGVSLTLLIACFKNLFLLSVALFSLDKEPFDLSYCIMFCPVWLLSLGCLVFSENGGRVDLGEKEEGSEEEWREEKLWLKSNV